VELLERIVRENCCTGALCDLKNEGVAAPDCTSRRSQQFSCEHTLFVNLFFGNINAMSKRSVDDYDHIVETVLARKIANSLIELRERRRSASFGCDVRAIYD
jgi:hypothetical protein